jgi:hypothetical protein
VDQQEERLALRHGRAVRQELVELRLAKARIELPLPAFGGGPAADEPDPAETGGSAVEIVSIDEIVLSDVEIVSGSRTLRGDIEASIEGQRVVVRSVELAADDTSITASGQITDMNAPAGELAIKADALNVDRLIAFASDFASGAGAQAAPKSTAGRTGRKGASGMNMVVTLDAARASMGGMTINKLTGAARLTLRMIVIDPVKFGLFDGQYAGSISANLAGRTPTFRWTATLTNVDVPAATAFAGAGVVTGKLWEDRSDRQWRDATIEPSGARVDVVDDRQETRSHPERCDRHLRA